MINEIRMVEFSCNCDERTISAAIRERQIADRIGDSFLRSSSNPAATPRTEWYYRACVLAVRVASAAGGLQHRQQSGPKRVCLLEFSPSALPQQIKETRRDACPHCRSRMARKPH